MTDSLVSPIPAPDSMTVPTRPVRMGEKAGIATPRADGSILLRSRQMPLPCTQTWNQRLVEWAMRDPDRTFLTESDGMGGRRHWTYGDAVRDVRAIAARLVDLPVAPDRPLAILAENSVDCARITLAGMFAGVPVAPISPSYALLATDFSRLRGVIESLRPGALYVADGARFGPAVLSATDPSLMLLTGAGGVEGRETIALPDMLRTEQSATSRAAEAGVALDSIAKILFTSGSSGAPKPVVLPHRMLADNRQQNMLIYAYLQDEPPILIDWLPWHHTFGGNNNFGLALWAGGALHIDEGRPTPDRIDRTIANLKRYPINLYMSSPSGFEALLPHLATDAALRTAFFANLKVLQYGGALLPTHLWKQIDDLAVAETGHRILMISGLGSTECGPTPMQSSWEQQRRPEAGLPVPGVTAKLVPFEDSLELRFKGDCVTPGYWHRPDLTAEAFDEEGYFRTGDTVMPIDPDDVTKGLLFHGRISDNFKLTSGTWVTVSPLRLTLLGALAPVLADAVIVGSQRAYVTAIGFVDPAAAREIAGLGHDASLQMVLESATLRRWIAERLDRLAAAAGGSSNRIARLVLEAEPPSLANGEQTDKGSAAPRAVLARRGAVVGELYAEPPSLRIIAVS